MDEADAKADGADAEEDGYVCPPCQRRKHTRCTDPECTCCLGNED